MICTFYSYKGGVGRSMALANVADILARRGLRVLMIDFDLEAPGLEQFFPINQTGVRRNLGLLDLVLSFKYSMSVAGGEDEGEFRRLKESFIVPVYYNLPSGGSLDLMPAGRRESKEQLARYAYNLRTLDWQDFYANWAGEAFFEWLRKEFVPGLYDVVLVDSRTGVTELGGICAYQLADTIVLFCASNHQNVEGTSNVVADIFSPGVAARRSNRPLQAIVLPARIEQHDDVLITAFRKRFIEAFDRYTPEPLRRAGKTFWDLAIPYEPQYAFEEQVITDPARTDERRPMVAAFQGVVDALVILAEPGSKLAALHSEAAAGELTLQASIEPQYDVTRRFADYDVYISYNTADREAVMQIVEGLESAGIRLFLDAWSLVPGQTWQEAMEEAVAHSRSCVVCIGPAGVGPWQNEELARILLDVTRTRADFRVIPLLLPGAVIDEVPLFLNSRTSVDFSRGPKDPETFRQLVSTIQRSPGLAIAQPTVEYRNPYLGLRAFSESDAPLFFGRDALVKKLLEKLKDNPLLALLGPSGSGKSSLVYSGLLPRLRLGALPGSEQWVIVTLTPGPKPLETLAKALSRLSAQAGATETERDVHTPTSETLAVDECALANFVQAILAEKPSAQRLLLVVDQLEELFVLTKKVEDRRAFIAAILRAVGEASNTSAILMLRADFYRDALDYPDLAKALSVSEVNIVPMTREELREAIERPAQAAGGSFEPGLVDRLLDDVGAETGVLPLLQNTLRELWERRRGGWLTHQAYDEIINVRRARPLLGPASVYDSEVWRLVQISEIGKESGVKMAGGLEFVLLTDQARHEQTLLAQQRPLIDGLVAEAIRRYDFRADLHAALYEVLLPNSIRDQVNETANLMLVLDPAAANYPWEMLCERGQEPLAVRYGLLRQLKTQRFRPAVQTSHGNYALVIGDPDTGDPSIPRLPGAREEAEAVAKELKKSGYEVVEKIDRSALEITSAFYAQEYRIVHITAHGSYDSKRPERSGVVLAKDMFLTAFEFDQLRVMPELVVLNCCFLSQVDEAKGGGKAGQQVRVPLNQMAASVAQQLIEIGVRAVVVAGWAVDDQASKDFAVQFYRHMLAEQGQFGAAVRRARKYIYEKHSQVNTWGAFQCYGLPTFALGGRQRQTKILEQLRRIQADALSAGPARQKELIDEVRRYDNALRDEWRTGSALYELGESYATLGELQPAITCYEDALTAKEDKSEVPIRTLERLANVEVRYAGQLRRAAQQQEADSGEKAAASSAQRKELLDDALNRLELALRFGVTTERLSLLGSCSKRLALESDQEERQKSLRRAAEYYERAVRQIPRQAEELPDLYPVLNWITMQFLANNSEENEKQQCEFLKEIENCVQVTSQRQAAQSSFWEQVSVADAALLRALIQGDLQEHADAVLWQYREVFQSRSTAYERESVLNQLDFLAEMLTWKEQHVLAGEVRRLRKKLEK